jgi:hypothetical protein
VIAVSTMTTGAQPCDLRQCGADADQIVLFADKQNHVRVRFFCGPHHSQYQRLLRACGDYRATGIKGDNSDAKQPAADPGASRPAGGKAAA